MHERMDGQNIPCILYDIIPLGPLSCLPTNASENYKSQKNQEKQDKGTNDHMLSLDDCFYLPVSLFCSLCLFVYLFSCYSRLNKSMCRSVDPLVRWLVGTANFWSAKKGRKCAKMRSVTTRRAVIRRVTTYFVYTNLFFDRPKVVGNE